MNSAHSKNNLYPILVVDKKGIIGDELAKKLREESLVVFVSKKAPQDTNNIIHVPFLKKFPTIPDNPYSYIFLVDEEYSITKDTITSFAKKAENDNSKLLLITNLDHLEKTLELIALSDVIKVSYLGDVFGKDYIVDPRTYVNKFIASVKSSGRIDIEGDGTKETRPIYIEDAVFGIIDALLGEADNEKIFYIFPKHKITLLSLAHSFQKIEPDIKIDFIPLQKSQENIVLPIEGKFLFEEYSLEDRIRKLNIGKFKESNKKETYTEPAKKTNFSFAAIVLAFMFFLFLPIISTLIFSFIGLNSLHAVKGGIEKGDFVFSKASAIVASKSFNIALASSAVLYKEAEAIGQEEKTEELIKKISFGNEIAGAAFSIIDASEKIKNVVSGKSKNPQSDFLNATAGLRSALFVYNKEVNSGLIPKDLSEKLADITAIASSTIDFWPDIFGFSGEKTYLVLFQNNMELRPGGGFIGSYAILKVNNGKIENFKIYDVYDADGQLTGHVEPPYPIRRFLPSVHWYLRDSNFNTDFSKGAVAAAVFLNSEMNQSVDGVIGVDLSFIKDLLSVTGPVKVADYNETVNADNFFEVTQKRVEKNFFPGSTQKKDFLKSFYTSLELKISHDSDLSYFKLLQAFANSMFEKHVIAAFNNSNTQAAFSVNGWSSSLADRRVGNQATINDFLGLSEANLGVDKVNYFITRSASQKAEIQKDGTVTEDLSVSFNNSATKEAWTGAGYKNYLRIILPPGTIVNNISIGGKNQKIVNAITDPTVYEKKGFIPPTGLEVQKDNENGKTIYGFLINLEPQELKTIRIKYTLSQKLNLSKQSFVYDHKIFKQPGVDFFPYDFSLKTPDNLAIINKSEGVNADSRNAVFVSQIRRDKEFTIDLAQK
jgi:hypothetical protein